MLGADYERQRMLMLRERCEAVESGWQDDVAPQMRKIAKLLRGRHGLIIKAFLPFAEGCWVYASMDYNILLLATQNRDAPLEGPEIDAFLESMYKQQLYGEELAEIYAQFAENFNNHLKPKMNEMLSCADRLLEIMGDHEPLASARECAASILLVIMTGLLSQCNMPEEKLSQNYMAFIRRLHPALQDPPDQFPERRSPEGILDAQSEDYVNPRCL